MLLETIKVKDRVILNKKLHEYRMKRSIKSIFGQNLSFDLSYFINIQKGGTFRCRVIYDTSIKRVEYIPYELTLSKSIKIVYDDSIDYSHKYENRESLNNLYSKRDCCDDVLIVKNSLITDTTKANVAFLYNNIWITPKKPLLEGTYREKLILNSLLKERDIYVDDINFFSKVALMNSMTGFYLIERIY